MKDRYQFSTLLPVRLLFGCLLLIPSGRVEGQSLPVALPEDVGMSTERLTRISSAMGRLVEADELAGSVTLIAREGKVVHREATGWLDREREVAMEPNTIFRIASMTKQITSVGIMILVEEGQLLLSDPVSSFIPEFGDPKVAVLSDPDEDDRRTIERLEDATRDITIRDLLTHRSGITYGFADDGPVGDLYRSEGIADGFDDPGISLKENISRLAEQPLVHQPGERYTYGLSTDVLGRVIEIVSGETLNEFLARRIFEPLRMEETWFYVPDDRLDRLAVLYTPLKETDIRPFGEVEDFGNMQVGGSEFRGSQVFFSGGGGLFSTADDYARFLYMLLNGGELEGTNVLSPKSIELMTVSHTDDLMPHTWDSAESFGLGFRIVRDLGRFAIPGTEGMYLGGGLYGTFFWVDPEELLFGIKMTQLYPRHRVRLRELIQTLTYQALQP